jgi:hypothetical protein
VAFCATHHFTTSWSWLGDMAKDSIQHLYGISFLDKKQLKVWKENQETVRLVSYPIYLYICLFGHDEQNLRISLSEIHIHDNRHFNPDYIGASFIHTIIYYYYVVMFDAILYHYGISRLCIYFIFNTSWLYSLGKREGSLKDCTGATVDHVS